MSKDTDTNTTNVQSFKDIGDFLSNHPQGLAIKQAVQTQGLGQVEPNSPSLDEPARKSGPSCR